MIALEPAARPSFREALESCRGTVFPESFYSFLHEYVAGVNEITNPSVFAPKPANAPSSSESAAVAAATTGVSPAGPISTASTAPGAGVATYESMLPNESDARIDRLWNDFEMLEPHLLVDNAGEETEKKPDKITGRTRTMPFQVSNFTETDNVHLYYLREGYLTRRIEHPKANQQASGWSSDEPTGGL